MDSEIESGREQAPAPGVGQGLVGGSIPEGNGEVHDGKAAPVWRPKRQEIVYLRWKGELLRCVTVAFQDFGGAIVVANGHGEFTVTINDLISEAQYLDDKFEENRNAARRQYSRVLDAWVSGLQTSKEISESIKWSRRDVAGALRSLAHWKLIEKPKKEDEQSPTDQPDIGNS